MGRRGRQGGRSSRGTGAGGRARTGVGRGGGRRRIVITQASPTGQVKGSSATIQAYVEDMRGTLSRRDIDVYLDGETKRFDYSRSSGSLRCSTGRLSSGTHTVEIEATPADGESRASRKRWTFSIKK